MSCQDIAELATWLRRFAADRDWEQFHSPKNIAMALSVEVAEIVEHFGVSERTIYRDIRSLEGMRIPIVHEDGGYGLMDGGRVRSLPLSPVEHALLRVALSQPALQKQPALARQIQVL